MEWHMPGTAGLIGLTHMTPRITGHPEDISSPDIGPRVVVQGILSLPLENVAGTPAVLACHDAGVGLWMKC
jgi:hypothetical protein